jgi:hypothetical protein
VAGTTIRQVVPVNAGQHNVAVQQREGGAGRHRGCL